MHILKLDFQTNKLSFCWTADNFFKRRCTSLESTWANNCPSSGILNKIRNPDIVIESGCSLSVKLISDKHGVPENSQWVKTENKMKKLNVIKRISFSGVQRPKYHLRCAYNSIKSRTIAVLNIGWLKWFNMSIHTWALVCGNKRMICKLDVTYV